MTGPGDKRRRGETGNRAASASLSEGDDAARGMDASPGASIMRGKWSVRSRDAEREKWAADGDKKRA